MKAFLIIIFSILSALESPRVRKDWEPKFKERMASGFKNQKASSLFGEALREKADPLAEGWKPPPTKLKRGKEEPELGPRLGRPIPEEFPDWLASKERGYRDKGKKKKWPGIDSILKGKHKEKSKLFALHEPKLALFDILDGKGNTVKLDYWNYPDVNVWLIVNTASEGGFAQQYAGLQELYEDYHSLGLEIIAFPSNSFGLEPLDNDEIQDRMKERYGVTFPIMGKCDVNGPNELEIFKWLKESALSGGNTQIPDWAPVEETGLNRRDIHWNFEKFLVIQRNKQERVLRFSYDTAPMDVAIHVDRALKAIDRKKKEL